MNQLKYLVAPVAAAVDILLALVVVIHCNALSKVAPPGLCWKEGKIQY